MTTETKTRVITLTNRAPVRINEDDWHVIAEGSVYAGQFESQANRRASMKVREHVTDGRVIVSGIYRTQWANERGRAAGVLLEGRYPSSDTSGGDEAVVQAVRRVAEDLGYDSGTLADDVIADLPAQPI